MVTACSVAVGVIGCAEDINTFQLRRAKAEAIEADNYVKSAKAAAARIEQINREIAETKVRLEDAAARAESKESEASTKLSKALSPPVAPKKKSAPNKEPH